MNFFLEREKMNNKKSEVEKKVISVKKLGVYKFGIVPISMGSCGWISFTSAQTCCGSCCT